MLVIAHFEFTIKITYIQFKFAFCSKFKLATKFLVIDTAHVKQ